MAIVHGARLRPTKFELLATWLPTQPWFSGGADTLQRVGAFRFDDPDGQVGVETLLVAANSRVYQIPLSYRNAPLEGAQAFLVGNIDHSVLGKRWVYDAAVDPVYLNELVAAAVLGKPQAIVERHTESGVQIVDPSVEIFSDGKQSNVLPQLEFSPPVTHDAVTSIPAGSLTLRISRVLDLAGYVADQDIIASPVLTATWEGQSAQVMLASL